MTNTTKSSETPESGQNALDEVVSLSLGIKDTLLKEVVEADAKDTAWEQGTGYKKNPHLDPVQLTVEKAVLNFSIDQGFQPYGTVMDALLYLASERVPKSPFYRTEEGKKRMRWMSLETIRKYIDHLADVIEAAANAEASQRALSSEVKNFTLTDIFGRYHNYCQFGQRGKFGPRSRELVDGALSPERHPYNIAWEPWFNGLARTLNGAKEYFGEDHKNSLI